MNRKPYYMHNMKTGELENVNAQNDIIENVRILDGVFRGDTTNKKYDAPEGIKMNARYDKAFIKKEDYMTPSEAVISSYNPREALEFTKGGRDKENVKMMRELKAKSKRILAKQKKDVPEKLFENILGKDGLTISKPRPKANLTREVLKAVKNTHTELLKEKKEEKSYQQMDLPFVQTKPQSKYGLHEDFVNDKLYEGDLIRKIDKEIDNETI